MSFCGTNLWSFPRYQKKIALVICNTYDLHSVMYDAKVLRDTLPSIGYSPNNIHIIVTGPITSTQQTQGVSKANLDMVPGAIVVNSSHELDSAIARVTGQVTPGTSFFISISSHGEQSNDGREKVLTHNGNVISDGSEYIKFVFGNTQVRYTDDRLRSMLIDTIPEGAEVMCLIDTCHSATMIDLPSSVSVNLTSRKAFVSQNLDAARVKCDCICFAPTIDVALTYEDLKYRGGMMTHIFTDYIKGKKCVNASELIIEAQKTLSIVGQTGVFTCSRLLKNGTYSID